MTKQLPDWIAEGEHVAIVLPRRGQWPSVEIGRVRVITTETVVVRTPDTMYRFRRNGTDGLTLWGATAQHSPTLVPLTDPQVVAAGVRAKVRAVGRTLTAMADDVRFGMEADDVADLAASLIALRDQLAQAIADLGEQLP